MKSCLRYSILLLFIINTSLNAQQKKNDKQFEISGNIGLFYDVYDYSEENFPNFRAKYPDNLFRLNANATIKIGKYFSIPFGINVSNQKTLYNLPSVPDENLIDYIRNPKNNISINPEYKWIKAHIGAHTPDYSELSTGDISIFGGGFDLNPGKFIISANYGISQIAVEADPLLNIVGAYKQHITTARIGYGKIDGSKFTINIVKIKDDVNSLVSSPIDEKPIEGLTIAQFMEVKFGKKLFFKTETAASMFTRDLLNTFELDSDIVDAVEDVISLNASSKADYSHISSLEWKSDKITLGGEIKYIGPGFIPAGFRNIEKDILDYKFKTALKFFKGKALVNGMFGIRTNNLQNTTLQSTDRVITNVNVFAQISTSFSINTSFANFGFNNNVYDDILRIEMINNTFSISPSYNFKTTNLNHQISANGNFNSFDQFDNTSASFVKSESKSYSLNYNILFKNIPLNINFMGLHLTNETPVSNFIMSNYGTTISYKLFNKKITPSLGLNFTNIALDPFSNDKRFNSRLKIDYKINKKLRFKFSYKLNKYTYGSSRPNALTKEHRIQFSLLKKF